MSNKREYVEVDNQGMGWHVTHEIIGTRGIYEHNVTRRTQLPVEISNWQCRACDSTAFTPKYKLSESPFNRRTRTEDRTIGGKPPDETRTMIISGHFCSECTVEFGDPAKFSKNQPAKIVPPIATTPA